MSWGIISKYILTDIADYIRGRKGSTAEIKPISMRWELDSIPTYEQGKQAEYDAFWDSVQEYGRRTNYESAFCSVGWNDLTFKPKYDLIVGDGRSGYSMFTRIAVTNLAERLEQQGVRLDTSKSGTLGYLLQKSPTQRIPEIDCTGITSASAGLEYAFYDCTQLKTIDKLVVKEELEYKYTFAFCNSLENITIEGVIGNNISFSNSSKLTNASVQSIIDHLKDLTGATAQTLTFHATVGAKLTDEQKATITAKNWTLVY